MLTRWFVLAIFVLSMTATFAHADAAREGGGITSETMHHIYGGAILGLSTTLVLENAEVFRAPRLRYVVPTTVMAAGLFLAIDPLLHGGAAPENYGAETRQHLLIGGMLAGIGAVDFAREAGWLEHWAWGLALPGAMLVTSAGFFLHAQHGDPAQHELLTVQHRALGATLAIAAVTKGLAAARTADGKQRWPQLETAWIVAAGIAGAQLLVYSEGHTMPLVTGSF